jgi:DNA end-binding protein Ku
VLLEDDELDAVSLESAKSIDIELFAPAGSIDWIWCDQPHNLIPNDPVGEEAYSVIRDAMQSTKTVGVSRLVLYGRERAVLLKPRDKGIVLWTLHFGDEVRDADEYFGAEKETKLDPKLMALVSTLIDERTKPWSTKMGGDTVQARLKEIIASNKKGEARSAKVRPDEAASPLSNVVNIMDALRKSIASDRRPKGR